MMPVCDNERQVNFVHLQGKCPHRSLIMSEIFPDIVLREKVARRQQGNCKCEMSEFSRPLCPGWRWDFVPGFPLDRQFNEDSAFGHGEKLFWAELRNQLPKVPDSQLFPW